MRTTLLSLFLVGASCFAAERPFDSGLSGVITITEAKYLLDGGSVSVCLRDEQGTEAGANYTQTLFYNPHGGQLSFRAPNATRSTFVIKGSAAEQALLHLLAAGCVHTFGTADPSVLRTASRGPDGQIRDFQRAAMAELFLQVESRNRQRPSTQTRK